MEIERRTFLKGAAATAAAGVVDGAFAAEDEVEKTIRETKYIDIHAHCTEFALPPMYKRPVKPLCEKDDLVFFYDNINVEKGVILALCNPENFIGGMTTEAILRTCAKAPDRFIPSVAIDPRCGVAARGTVNCPFTDFESIFKYYRDKGCKVCGEVCANLHFIDPIMQNYFKGVEAAGLPLDFHLAANKDWKYGIIDEPGLPELELCLQRFPKLRFFGHSQSFWCEIGEYNTWDERTQYPSGPVKNGRIPELMRKYPNLYCDISAGSGNNALARDLDHAGRFLTEFQDRILFGIDICAPQHFIDYASPEKRPDGKWYNEWGETLRTLLRTGRITPAIYRKVCRENAIRELGLS